ncbi:MAG: HNH endonuclease [Chitinophagaceae bacterium]
MADKKTLKILKNERWKKIPGHVSGGVVAYSYAISNQGRLIKYRRNFEDGIVLRLSREGGYPIWRKRMDGNYYAALLHRLVAKYFLGKPSPKERFIIHMDHNKENNKSTNLKWATQEEVTRHNRNNPTVKAFLKERKANHFITWSKLTAAKVIAIKKMLQRGKTLKEIAAKYGVSDMQVHRIKTGENWGHVKVGKL